MEILTTVTFHSPPPSTVFFSLISHVIFTILLQVKHYSCLIDRKLKPWRVTRCWQLHSKVENLKRFAIKWQIRGRASTVI